MSPETFELLLTCAPGLENAVADEAREKSFSVQGQLVGGVLLKGGWPDVWRANLTLRGANSVLARIGSFPASHMSELDKRARKFEWARWLPKHVPLKVTASCKASRLYHSGAVCQRIETALREEFGAEFSEDAPIEVMARIERNICTLSIDTSGVLLHKRGLKQATAKAPMRETMAAMMLRQCSYRGLEPVLDPMCGSGTFILEAAEIAQGLLPGRVRQYAFEKLPSFNDGEWQKMKMQTRRETQFHFLGYDRDAGAIKAATANAARAGVLDCASFAHQPISVLKRPEGPPGLVICNPPYGARIGDLKKLSGLYASLGHVLRHGFSGWRVGLITNEASLAKATGLPFAKPSEPIVHGGIKIRLYQSPILH